MPRKQQQPKRKTAAKAAPAAKKRPPLAELSPAQRRAHEAELTATMEEHREGYLAYERAHLAMRAGKLGAAQAAKVKAANREAHRTYWSCYERRRALRKLMPAAAGERGDA